MRSVFLQLLILQGLFLWNHSFRVLHSRRLSPDHNKRCTFAYLGDENEPRSLMSTEDKSSQLNISSSQSNISLFGKALRGIGRGLSYINPFKKSSETSLEPQTKLTSLQNSSNPNPIVVFFRRRLLNIWGSKSTMWPTGLQDEMGLRYIKKNSVYSKSMRTSDRSRNIDPNDKNWFISKFVNIFDDSGDDDDGKLRVLLRRRNNKSRIDADRSEESMLDEISLIGASFRKSIRAVKGSFEAEDQSFRFALRPPDGASDLDLDDMIELFDVSNK